VGGNFFPGRERLSLKRPSKNRGVLGKGRVKQIVWGGKEKRGRRRTVSPHKGGGRGGGEMWSSKLRGGKVEKKEKEIILSLLLGGGGPGGFFESKVLWKKRPVNSTSIRRRKGRRKERGKKGTRNSVLKGKGERAGELPMSNQGGLECRKRKKGQVSRGGENFPRNTRLFRGRKERNR